MSSLCLTRKRHRETPITQKWAVYVSLGKGTGAFRNSRKGTASGRKEGGRIREGWERHRSGPETEGGKSGRKKGLVSLNCLGWYLLTYTYLLSTSAFLCGVRLCPLSIWWKLWRVVFSCPAFTFSQSNLQLTPRPDQKGCFLLWLFPQVETAWRSSWVLGLRKPSKWRRENGSRSRTHASSRRSSRSLWKSFWGHHCDSLSQTTSASFALSCGSSLLHSGSTQDPWNPLQRAFSRQCDTISRVGFCGRPRLWCTFAFQRSYFHSHRPKQAQ